VRRERKPLVSEPFEVSWCFSLLLISWLSVGTV
jgi:hypothetical protein